MILILTRRPVHSLFLAGIWALSPTSLGADVVDGGPEAQLVTQDASTLVSLTEVLNILASTDETPRGRALALAGIASIGPKSIPAITTILAGRASVPAELQKEGPLLTRNREALLFEVMRSWDSGRVALQLKQQLEASPSLSLRIVTIRLLGEVGNAHCLRSFLEIVAGLDPIQLAHPSVRQQAVSAMSAVLQRDALAYVALEGVLHELSPELVEFSVEGIGRAGRVAGVDLLKSLLGRSLLMDEKILASLAGIGARDLWWAAPTVRAIVRPFLSSPHAGCRLHAARTLGTLRDPEAFTELAEMLDDPDARVAESALASLRSMSRTSWPAASSRWLRWYRREAAWAKERGQELDEILAHGDSGSALKAIRELAQHPLFAGRLAEALGNATQHVDRTVAVLACEALGQLGCPAALDPLVEALWDPRQDVREAALFSLKASTGEDFRADGAAWRNWLEG